MGDAEEDDKQKQDQEQERLAAAKKRRDQDKRQFKKERQAEELEKNRKLEALAAAAAAEAAAVAAVEEARMEKKAAAAAEVEALRLAKIAAKKSKKNNTEDLDDLTMLELAIAANDKVGGVKATAGPVAASKSLPEPDRAAELRDALKARKQLVEKSRRKVAKPPNVATPSAEEAAKAAALATAAEIQRNRNIQRERDAQLRRAAAKNDKTKAQPIPTSPVDMPMLETAPSPDSAQRLHDLELELVSLEAEMVDTSGIVVLDRVTELMIKLDDVPVASTELRARRRIAIARADALAVGLRDGAN